MYNRVILTGRVGRDVELKTSKNGNSYCAISLATNTGYGENRRTDWHNITAFGKVAEACARNLVKGAIVEVEGSLQYEHTEKDGKKYTNISIIANNVYFISGCGKKEEQPAPSTHSPDDNPFIETQDDLPF